MNNERIKEEIGIFKMLFTVLAVVFVSLTSWIFANINAPINILALAYTIDTALLCILLFTIINLFTLLKKL